jgi:hypothetical protein
MLQVNAYFVTKVLNRRAGADGENGRLLAHSFHLANCFAFFFCQISALFLAFVLPRAKAAKIVMF